MNGHEWPLSSAAKDGTRPEGSSKPVKGCRRLSTKFGEHPRRSVRRPASNNPTRAVSRRDLVADSYGRPVYRYDACDGKSVSQFNVSSSDRVEP